ncbi:MAG: ABC transporter permease [Chloroflexi bacterium]|nr:ABC transporter permease [Chloroflexota bacterium]
MAGYLARRLTLAVPVLLGILFVTFALARLLPGDPCRSALGERATEQICEAFNERYGLNESIPEQFRIYLRDVLSGDLGESIKFGRPVTELMVERLPVTVELTFFAMLFAVLIGIPMGLVSAYYHNSSVDVLTMITANIGVSMPVFWLGLMLSYLFGVAFRDTVLWLPPSGRLSAGISIEPFYAAWGMSVNPDALTLPGFIANINTLNALLVQDWNGLGDALRHMILPAMALGTIPMSIIARMTRSSLLEVLGLNYVRTARAKGVRETKVVLKHAFRNALLPVVTIIGLSLGSLLSGAVLTETVFGLSGVGRILYDSITGRDYTVVQGFTLIIAVIFVFINLVVDTLYAYLDPRIRLE